MYDVRVRREECVRFDFLERQAHAFLPKRTSDLLEGEELLIRVVLYEVYI
jgi:hypothetical protein